VAVALGVALALALLAVGYLISRGASNRLARLEAQELAHRERARRDALEAAAEADRLARVKELDAKISAVRNTDDAARLVREQLSRLGTRRPL
jgi:hypothetical protein